MVINILELELGALFIGVWLASLAAMWFLVDRPSRPGRIRSVAAIESMMLVSIMSLLLGITFFLWATLMAD